MKNTLIICGALLLVGLNISCRKKSERLCVGTYTEAGEKGFYLIDLYPEKGVFHQLSVSDAGTNPSYFCISEKSGLIYTVNEVSNFNGHNAGGVSALKYDSETSRFIKVREIPVPNGGPCYISLSPSEDYLFIANYGGGSVAVVKLDEGGIPERIADTIFYGAEDENVSHTHMISFDPAGKRVYLTDLGLDRVVIFDFDNVTGRLRQIPDGIVKMERGAGPRHFVFNSSGTKMYVINELNSTISVFNVSSGGGLEQIQTINTLREGFKGTSYCADIHIGKEGKFLYGSNRGENTIVTFRIGNDGKLTLAGHTSCGGNWPRNFTIDPSGKYILIGNQKSDNISIFRLNKTTGIPVEPGTHFKIKSPACLKFIDNK